MAGKESFRRNLTLVTLVIVVASVVGAAMVALTSAPGINFFTPYQELHADATITPPSSTFNVSIGANDSNIQVYQGGNNSLFIDVSVTGWFKLSNQNVYITKEITGNTLLIFIHTPRFLASYSAASKVYLPSASKVDQLSVDTSNGNINLYGPLKAGNSTLATTNGNILVTGLDNGTIGSSTVNGNINIVASALQSCSETAVNGNLQLTISSIVRSGSFSLSSVNGNQEVQINRLSNATLSLSTVNGNILASNLAIDTTQSSSRSLQGTINGGGAVIDMKATNGNLRITGT